MRLRHMTREEFFQAWREECRKFFGLMHNRTLSGDAAMSQLTDRHRAAHGPLLLDQIRNGALFVEDWDGR